MFYDLLIVNFFLKIIANHLNHGSPRFLQKISRCLTLISDSPALVEQNIDKSLEMVLQILGSADMELVYNATGFLGNAQTKNICAKVNSPFHFFLHYFFRSFCLKIMRLNHY